MTTLHIVLVLDEEDIDNLLLGAALLSSGVGCSLEKIMKIVKSDVDKFGTPELITCKEVSRSRGITFSVYLNRVERISDVEKCIEKIPQHVRSICSEDIVGISTHALDTCNVTFAIHVSLLLNIPLIDCDCTGRGLIDYIHSIYFAKNKTLNPTLIFGPDGECTYLHPMTSPVQLSKLCRRYSTTSPIVVVGSFSKSRNVCRNYICGSISRTIKVGRELKRLRRSRDSDLRTILRIIRGFVLFKGIVEECYLEKVEGSIVGLLRIRGVDSWCGFNVLIYVRDGTIIVVKDSGKPLGMVPDIVTLLSDDYMPITYEDSLMKCKVYIVGIRAPDEWRTRAGLSLLNPRYFGIDMDYIPIELLAS